MALRTRVFGPELLTDAVMARFWPKVDINNDGCWNWTAAKTAVGYGRFGIGQTAVFPSHRISVVWATQEAIPNGMDVDHLCKNTSCVNPLHLEVVDRRTNIIRSTTKGAVAAGGETCHRGHDLTLPNAWTTAKPRSCRLCRNERSLQRQKTPAERAKRNERRKRKRLSDPAWAELERQRQRRRRGRG